MIKFLIIHHPVASAVHISHFRVELHDEDEEQYPLFQDAFNSSTKRRTILLLNALTVGS